MKKGFTLIELLMCIGLVGIVVLIVLIVVVVGIKAYKDTAVASQISAQVVQQPATAPALKIEPPVISYEGRVSIGKIDPKDISKTNPGYNVDMNGDGTDDFVIMKDNTVYFKDGRSGEEAVILVIKGSVEAYCVRPMDGQVRPSVLFWDTNHNGYYQPNLGNRGSIPFFGSVESQ